MIRALSIAALLALSGMQVSSAQDIEIAPSDPAEDQAIVDLYSASAHRWGNYLTGRNLLNLEPGEIAFVRSGTIGNHQWYSTLSFGALLSPTTDGQWELQESSGFLRFIGVTDFPEGVETPKIGFCHRAKRAVTETDADLLLAHVSDKWQKSSSIAPAPSGGTYHLFVGTNSGVEEYHLSHISYRHRSEVRSSGPAISEATPDLLPPEPGSASAYIVALTNLMTEFDVSDCPLEYGSPQQIIRPDPEIEGRYETATSKAKSELVAIWSKSGAN